MNLDQLNEPKLSLLAFGSALGIGQEIWERREEAESLLYSSEDIKRDDAVSMKLEVLSKLNRAWGDALTCKFKYGDLEVLNVDASLNQERLDNFRLKINPTPLVSVEIRINKQKLATRLFSSVEDSKIYFFLFSARLEKHLAQALPTIEKQVWDLGRIPKAIFFVPEMEILLDGPHISVVGGSNLEKFNPASLQKPTDPQRLQQIYSACQDNLKWQEQWLVALTPLHFKFKGLELIETTISKVLAIHATELAILYTAERTILRNGWISTYTGSNKSVQIQVKSSLQNIDLKLLSNTIFLLQLFEWVYEEGKTSDRLPLVQSEIARTLEYSVQENSYDHLLSNIRSIFDNASWQWKAFIEKKVQGYLGQVQALEDYIANTVNAYSANIGGLVKSLTDTMLAAVAVVATAFITTLLKDQGNQLIVSLTIWLYALYVFLFPLIFNMLNQYGQYKTLSTDYLDRNNRFKSVLFAERVDEIVGGRIKNAQVRFKRWFWAAILAYVALIIALVIAGFFLPGWLTSVKANGTINDGQTSTQNSSPRNTTVTPKASNKTSSNSVPNNNSAVKPSKVKNGKTTP